MAETASKSIHNWWRYPSSNWCRETRLSLRNRATRLEVSQCHQTIRYVMYGLILVCYSNFVPEIFDFEKCCDLETRVRVTQSHWKWYLSKDWVWFPISVLHCCVCC